jgi:uncharacterized membrane protein
MAAFCGKCGTSMDEGLAFCPKCGAPAGPIAAVPAGAPAPGPIVTTAGAPTSGLAENVAGLLCYVLGWLTGLIFLLVDKRPFVRFHAAQSIVVFGALFILRMVFWFSWFGSWGLFSLWTMLSLLLSLVTFIAWIVLMIFAYQGKMFEVPIAAGVARSIAGNPKL